jgi:phosphomannomutase
MLSYTFAFSPLASSWNVDALNSSTLLREPFDEMFKTYFENMLAVIPPKFININNEAKLKIVYTAMHGVGYPFVERAFEVANLQPLHAVIEQRDADPEFPTVKFPNPEEGKSCLELSMKLADKIGSDLILANDPDADRLAVAERDPRTKKWKVFNGNEIGSLLGWWSLQYYKEKYPGANLNNCYILASTVSSKMLKTMSRVEGFNFEETLTGFKWMGNRSVELIENHGKEVLFAFEEAIGFMFSPTVLDKDGVSAAAHLGTMASYLKIKEGKSLCEMLDQLYADYGYHYSINNYFLCYEPEKIVKIFERMRNWNGKCDEYPSSILNGKYKIASIRDLTTGIDTAQSDRKSLLPSSKSSQMITFTLENDTVVTLRTSGTEPKIKYYSEYCAKIDER